MKETGTRKLFVWHAKHLVFEQNCFADSSQDVTQNTKSRKQHQNQYVDEKINKKCNVINIDEIKTGNFW